MSERPGPLVWMLYLVDVGEGAPLDGETLCAPWKSHVPLVMGKEEPAPDGGRFSGQQADGTVWQIAWELRDETLLLRVTAERPASHTCADWPELRGMIDGVEAQARRHPGYRPPWAASVCYHAAVPADGLARAAPACLETLGLDAKELFPADDTRYGLLWQSRPEVDGEGAWRHTLVLVGGEDRAPTTRESFLDPLHQGLARIELFLARCVRLRHEYEEQDPAHPGVSMGRRLGECREDLQRRVHSDEVRRLLWLPVRQEQRPLRELAESQMEYLAERERAEVQLHRLELNRRNLALHLQRARLMAAEAAGTPAGGEGRAYIGQARQLAQAGEQIRADLALGRATLECAAGNLEILRTSETNQLQRYSFVFAAAALLLAGVTIFGSFLDIWSLALHGSAAMPPPVWSHLLALCAAVSGPAAAYALVVGKTRWAILAAAVLVAAIAGAVALTVG